MISNTVNETRIVEALHRVPVERWGEVLQILEGMTQLPWSSNEPAPICTGTDLRDSSLIGIWADRTDVVDNRDFARQLRKQASGRGIADAPGH